MRILCIAVLLCLGFFESVAEKAASAQEKGKVIRELISGDPQDRQEKVLRITGKARVIDAGTLAFEDGTRVTVATTMDTPTLEQKGMIGDKLYPAGKQAADFLRTLIGEKPVSFYAWGNEEEQGVLRGRCFIGETQLGIEMVRNGWATSRHSTMVPYEIMARENRRGLWRGTFVPPDRWRKGERLKEEDPPSP